MRRSFAFLLALAALGCGGGPNEVDESLSPWRHRPPRGYVNFSTMEQETPAGLYERGIALHEKKRYEEAVRIFRVLSETAPDTTLRSNALFMTGHALLMAGAYLQAYPCFEKYQASYPDGDFASRSKAHMLDCALGMARVGTRDTFLGLPILTTSKTGVELLKSLLLRFPREEFSDDYYYQLAEFHHERGEYDEAELELHFILTDPAYKRSNSAPRALLFLGQIGLERYAGPNYDHKPLLDAKRAYEQFEIDYKRFENDAQAAREAGIEDIRETLATARAGIKQVKERLAERNLVLAQYYYDMRGPLPALAYLQDIAKNYPDTTVAGRAAKLRQKLEADLAELKKHESSP